MSRLCVYDPDGGINDRVTAAKMALLPRTGCSQSDIARRMGVTRSYICHLLKGRRTWTEKLAKQFVEAL